MSPDPELQRLAARLRLVHDPRRATGLGAFLSRGPGASLEFHDHRDYAPGDDPRHLDWSAWARTGRPVVRRHRAEASPRLEVLLDASASMALTPAKARHAARLAELWLVLAEQAGARPALHLLGAARGPGRPWRPLLDRYAPAGAGAALPPPCPGAERILISDGLCPDGPEVWVRRLGDGAAALHLVQVLDDDERRPTARGRVRLDDVEGGHLEVVLDDDAIAAYLDRLERLRQAWRGALHGRGRVVDAPVGDPALAARAAVAAGLLAWREGR
ncbi:MAG: hypothetical protein RLZZ127_988 [Planctomycetota bacterium]